MKDGSHRALSAGFDTYLTKPARLSDIMNLLAECRRRVDPDYGWWQEMIHVVDDEEISLRLAESICQSLSLEAGAWRNSSDFLQSAASVFTTDDILLLDVYMPGSDAIDVLKFLYDQKRSVRLVLVSGHNSETLTLTANMRRLWDIN